MIFPRGKANLAHAYGGYSDLDGNGEMTGVAATATRTIRSAEG